MNDIETLQAANVVKLQSAARMAGLRWKSGTPGYDKAGIIGKLSNHPSIMRATLATLARMGGENPTNIFADDLDDDYQIPTPKALVEPQAPSVQSAGFEWSKIVQAIQQAGIPINARLDKLESRATILERTAFDHDI